MVNGFRVRRDDQGYAGGLWVGKKHCKERHHYVEETGEALEFGDLELAKGFARSWADRLEAKFSVWGGGQRRFSVTGVGPSLVDPVGYG